MKFIRKVTYFVFALVLSVQSALAVNDFEAEFQKLLPVLQAEYVPVSLKFQEILEMKERLGQSKSVVLEKQDLPFFKKGYFLPHELGELTLALNALKAAQTEVAELQTALDQAIGLFSQMEAGFREKFIVPMANKYSWGVPTDEAIQQIAEYEPLLELGAGAGYWAYLLRKQGADILAYDNFSWSSKNKHQPERNWIDDIIQGDETILDSSDTSRTLFMCWPSTDEFAFNAIQRYRGDTFIYVGELPGDHLFTQPAHGNEKFFRFVSENFELIQEVSIPNWPGYQDKVYVFERNGKKKSCRNCLINSFYRVFWKFK